MALAALVAVWRPLLALSVHEDLAAAEGVATERIKLIFVLVLALVVAIAIKIVGVLLTIAFLIMPAAAARPLAETPEQMAVIAAVFGMLSVASGLFLSITLDTPGGPSIVLMLAVFFAASIFPTVLRRPALEALSPERARRGASRRGATVAEPPRHQATGTLTADHATPSRERGVASGMISARTLDVRVAVMQRT